MAAGVADKLWALEHIAQWIEASPPKAAMHWPYKKRA
jgi:hypothetical protein